MLDRCYRKVQSLLFGCLACLVLTSVVNADGRVFVLDLRNSSGLQGVRDAEQACASQRARLASAEELHHAVAECFFSPCTSGWLHGGKIGTTVCNIVGSALKAVDVRMENATDATARLDAFCIKNKDAPCGDPPSFPNARLQGRSGFEMGDELLYTCVPGYVMPSGQSAFSLLCDSCGEWYGLVQICVRDHTEGHVDYEDEFTDPHGAAEPDDERPEEAHSEVTEEAHGAPDSDGKMKEQQETTLNERPDENGEHEVLGEVIDHSRAVEGDGSKDRAVEDFIGHPTWEQEMVEEVRTDTAEATEAPVSLLSQKHMFWFPSEAFQEEGSPVSTNPVTQTTQRASGGQSEESAEHKSQEGLDHQHPVDVIDHDDEGDGHDEPENVDGDDHDDGEQDIQDSHYDDDDKDSHYDDGDEADSRQHEDAKLPAGYDESETRDRHDDDDDHDDHYDMGEHEEDNDHHGSREFDDEDDARHEQEIYDDHDDVTDDHDREDGEHPEASEEHSEYDDHDDHEGHDDGKELSDTDEDDQHDHDDHDEGLDDPDSHEDDRSRQRETFSVSANERHNVAQKETVGEATTDETWLDGYPVVQEETENDSTRERSKPEDTERGSVQTTDRPNEVEIHKPAPFTTFPTEQVSPTVPEVEQGEVEEAWPGFTGTSSPADDLLEPSDSPSFSDTLDYDTQQAAPTHSWLGDLTQDPFLDHGPAPPVHDDDDDIFPGVIEEHTVRDLPGETGERGEVEGDMEETICVGDDCPPNTPTSSSRGPTVAAIIVAVCAIATAVIVGVWCYQRQQRKSSMYEMNGKGQSQSRQAQQIEMQQKV